MFIDTHAHLNFREFEKEVPDVVKRAKNAQVGVIINVGSNYETSKKTIEIAHNHELDAKMYAAIGCHPIHLAKDIVESATFDGKEYTFKTKKEVFDKKKYQKLIDENKDKIVAIGETGLDYYRMNEYDKLQNSNNKLQIKSEVQIINDQKTQRQVFIEHIELARENNLPLILHCRGSEEKPFEAYDEMIEIFDDKRDKGFKGIVHCFTGNLKQAKKFINLGFYIGVNGIVTFKNSIELQDIIRQIPLENLVLETDCPFLAPDPYRGKRNEPQYIPVIAQKIAQLKNIDVLQVENTTTNNALSLFNIKKI